MAEYGNHPDFAVGEYWTSDTQELIQYLRDSGHCMKLFDVPLHYRLCKISEDPRNADIRNVFEGTLSDIEPEFSAPFSDNHDTQPSQALESWVQEWFKPLSYALLLLRDCYYPFVFMEIITELNEIRLHRFHYSKRWYGFGKTCLEMESSTLMMMIQKSLLAGLFR